MKKILGFLLLLSLWDTVWAEEGMWMLNKLDAQTVKQMRELGLELSSKQLYNPNGASLKDAVVSFGGFCTGVVVSPDGLVFTNHHCGFEAIQEHSTPEHDYLKEGFVAHTRGEELPNPDLFVSFLLRTDDVTDRVLNHLPVIHGETERTMVIDSICQEIQNEAVAHDSTLTAIVSPYYDGNEYYLSVYKDYKDVRLVFAPPSSVGKFGGDTDNWVWPRQTGDFSVFRIYADAANQPAAYDPTNVPYHPTTYAPISLNGYQEGSYSMTIGYPGETQRYLSSFGIRERMEGENAAMIQVRGIKQALWKARMDAEPAVRIMYDAKYAQSANYWKNSIGMNESIEKLHIIEKKQQLEQRLMQWIQQKPDERQAYIHILTELENCYRERAFVSRSFAFLVESFFNASDLLQNAMLLLTTDFSEENPNAAKEMDKLMSTYDNVQTDLDKKVFTAMLRNYREQMHNNAEALPETYQAIDSLYKGDYEAYADSVFAHTRLTRRDSLVALLERGDKQELFSDPLVSLAIDVMVKMQDLRGSVTGFTERIQENERLLNEAIRKMDESQTYYSDANSTMRMSFGMVSSLPGNGSCSYYCSPKGIFEKVRDFPQNNDFKVEPELLKLLAGNDFGHYRDARTKDLQLCFITNNDITGGNSGSPVFNGKGELMGLAFDGNWEAMSSDIVFEPNLQRCICVDIRYVLFMMDKWGCAKSLMQELKQ